MIISKSSKYGDTINISRNGNDNDHDDDDNQQNSIENIFGENCWEINKININNQNKENLNLEELLFDFCKDCSSNMPSIPPGAFAACKIREQNERNMTVNIIKNTSEKSENRKVFSDKQSMEYTPVKYNSKLMNAIWGHYNRYSPHNIKSNDGDGNVGRVVGGVHQQQSSQPHHHHNHHNHHNHHQHQEQQQ